MACPRSLGTQLPQGGQGLAGSADFSSVTLFCRSTQQSFLRLLTNAELLQAYGNKPLSNSEAWAVYESLLSDFRIGLKSDEPWGLEAYWREYAVRETSSGKLWMDAYLAAFCRAGNFEMVTIDRAFQQFEALRMTLLGHESQS